MVKEAAENAATSKVTGITAKVTKLLTPLTSADRQRVMRASFTLLGESVSELDASKNSALPEGNRGGGAGHSGDGIQGKAAGWMKTNEITTSQLEQVFDTNTGEMFGTNVPGKSAKVKTVNTYVLQGISSLLAKGEPTFQDREARKLCENVGCFNAANHVVYVAAKGNLWAGSKEKGWKLTMPGLRKAAELVREIAKE